MFEVRYILLRHISSDTPFIGGRDFIYKLMHTQSSSFAIIEDLFGCSTYGRRSVLVLVWLARLEPIRNYGQTNLSKKMTVDGYFIFTVLELSKISNVGFSIEKCMTQRNLLIYICFFLVIYQTKIRIRLSLMNWNFIWNFHWLMTYAINRRSG